MQYTLLAVGIMLYLHSAYILVFMDLLSLPYSTHIKNSSVISADTSSFLLSNGTYWNNTYHSLLRNADTSMIQSDSTTPGKIH